MGSGGRRGTSHAREVSSLQILTCQTGTERSCCTSRATQPTCNRRAPRCACARMSRWVGIATATLARSAFHTQPRPSARRLKGNYRPHTSIFLLSWHKRVSSSAGLSTCPPGNAFSSRLLGNLTAASELGGDRPRGCAAARVPSRTQALCPSCSAVLGSRSGFILTLITTYVFKITALPEIACLPQAGRREKR